MSLHTVLVSETCSVILTHSIKHLFNFVVQMAQFFLHKQRVLKGVPNTPRFLPEIL